MFTLIAPLDVASSAWADAAAVLSDAVSAASQAPDDWIAALARAGSERLARIGGSESALLRRLVDLVNNRLPHWVVETETSGEPDIVLSRGGRRIGIDVKTGTKPVGEVTTLRWEHWQEFYQRLVIVLSHSAPPALNRTDRIDFVSWESPLDNETAAQAILAAADGPH